MQVEVMKGCGVNLEVSLERCSRTAKFQLVWASEFSKLSNCDGIHDSITLMLLYIQVELSPLEIA